MIKRFLSLLITLPLLAALVWLSASIFQGTKSIRDLLENNQKLKAAIASLTHEDQIGFVKVLHQETRNGTLYTTLRFVETARGDPLTPVLEKEIEIQGDIAHFDLLMVTFPTQSVMDGKSRALYLWRRIYGEHQAPAEGVELDTPGTHPERYADFLKTLRLRDQQVFWESIWSLANDPEALRDQGINAIYGNAVYFRLRPGWIYHFKIGADGQVYPETVPDF